MEVKSWAESEVKEQLSHCSTLKEVIVAVSQTECKVSEKPINQCPGTYFGIKTQFVVKQTGKPYPDEPGRTWVAFQDIDPDSLEWLEAPLLAKMYQNRTSVPHVIGFAGWWNEKLPAQMRVPLWSYETYVGSWWRR